MTRIYIGALAVLAVLLGLSVYRGERLAKRVNLLVVENKQKDAQLDTERQARKHEQEIARNASNQFQATVRSIQNELASRPLKPVVIRVPVRTSDDLSASARAPTGSDAEAQGREHGAAEVDIATELTAAWLDCQENTAKLEALQSWVMSR